MCTFPVQSLETDSYDNEFLEFDIYYHIHKHPPPPPTPPLLKDPSIRTSGRRATCTGF